MASRLVGSAEQEEARRSMSADWYCTACGELMRWVKGKGYQCRRCDG